jgi:hypothetical protein
LLAWKTLVWSNARNAGGEKGKTVSPLSIR